jgi:hypothetical protein
VFQGDNGRRMDRTGQMARSGMATLQS